MATCGVFLLVGWEGSAYSRLALMVGAIVCIAISNAGTCSQDLKTGFLVGATPIKQQGALLIGVLTSVLAIGWTAYLLNRSQTTEKPVAHPFLVAEAARARSDSVEGLTDKKDYLFVRLANDDVPKGEVEGTYLVDATSGEARWLREDGIGAGRLQAPQAKLMSVVIDGLLTHKLPWNLILLGVAIAVFIEMLGFRSLTFAVGVYLPLSSTMPVFLGGVVRKIADHTYKRPADAEDETSGTLWCSGLIAGASILGILAAMQSFLPGFDTETYLHPKLALLVDLPFQLAHRRSFGVVVLALLGFLMWRGAADPKKD
jgi:uncharacterized oligopeptide transporter (OPT) family protein